MHLLLIWQIELAVMAQCKASAVDSFVSKPNKSLSLILLYGPDQGLVSERADKIIQNMDIDVSDQMSISRFDADDIASDPARLSDEAFAISMFGNDKVIRIKGTTRKNLLPALKPVLENQLQDCWIVFEAGDLKRDSALRKLVEKSTSAMALPCFQDNASALEQLIAEEITTNGLTIDRDTKDYLRSFLGDDRRASRNELKKLALYAHGTNAITREQITALLGNVSSVANDDIVDAASLGKVDFLNLKFDQLMESGGSADMLIWATLRHFQMLHRFRAAMEKNNSSPATLVASARPPIHFSRRDSTVKSIQMWTLNKLNVALQRLNNAFYETRSKPALANSIAATTLLAIALHAKKR